MASHDNTVKDPMAGDYALCRPPASLATSPGGPALAVVREAIDAIVVPDELRAVLEPASIPGPAFFEPLLVGGFPAH